MKLEQKIPESVQKIINTLENNYFEAYLVGGAIRDLLLGLEPKDWDIATSAMPEEVLKLFRQAIPTGIKFGTVTIKGEPSVEVTTFRGEGRYVDGRKPETVKLGVSLLEDLSRRDFTINALAYSLRKNELIDPYQEKDNLEQRKLKIITIGKPEQTFSDDGLRMLRAISIYTKLLPKVNSIDLASETLQGIELNRERINLISKERIQMELNKILLSQDPDKGIELLSTTKLLGYLLPELEKTKGVLQPPQYHKYDVFRHTLTVLKNVPSQLVVRLAALLHDIGKPECKEIDIAGEIHFYGHDKVSAALSRKILGELKYSKELLERVSLLIENHMFSYPSTEAGIRRLIKRVGKDEIDNLLLLRKGDIIGTGRLDFKEYDALVSGVKNELNKKVPLKLQELALNGKDIMREFQLQEGPVIGRFLAELNEVVLENPENNQKEVLLQWLKNKYF